MVVMNYDDVLERRIVDVTSVCVCVFVIVGERFTIYPKIDYLLTGKSLIEQQRRRIRIHKSLSNICNSEWRQLLSKQRDSQTG